MNLMLHLSLWGVLLAATIAVALYRKWLEDHCDHYVHLHSDSHDAAVIQSQEAACRRIETFGKLRTLMISLTIAYALIIAGVASYQAWLATNS